MKSVKVYVGEDKKLHFVDSSGADTVIPLAPYRLLNLLQIRCL